MGGLWAYVIICVPSVFIIVDPLGAVPAFLAITANEQVEQQRHTARRACMISGGVLLLFALSGNLMFQVFGITIAALRMAGGVVLFSVGIDMLSAQPSRKRQTDEELQDGMDKPDVALVPLAIPILSGPGAIATVMSLGVQARSWMESVVLVLSILLTEVVALLVLSHSHAVKRVLGATGLKILGRIMGLILATIAVQFILDGLVDALPPLARAWNAALHPAPPP